MPIRLRLTLWYCLIFGLLLVTVTSSIYISHRTSHYKEIDRSLTSVSTHFKEEVEEEIRGGKPLEQIRLSAGEFTLSGVYTVLKDANGKKIVSNLESNQLPHSPFADISTMTKDTLHTVTDPVLGRYRMLIQPIRINQQMMGYIQSEISLQQIDMSLNRLGWLIVGFTLIGIVLAALVGWFLAKKALSRVELISDTAKAIAASQGFHQRVMHEGPKDELGELAETFNRMLESLENAYVSQKRFIADASHELRAPLTTIRGNLDILQKMKGLPAAEKEEILSDIRNEAVRMSKMVADLLSLARADAGQEVRKQIADLTKIAKEVETEIQAWKTEVSIKSRLEKKVATWGDPDLLKQLLLILVENAVRYTRAGGTVTLAISGDKENATVKVIDTGIGIDSKDLPHIFDRFYRSEAARAHSPDGTGLGLSIAKWIVDQHGGSFVVTSTPGRGTEFLVNFPKVQ
ncbi:sensor histidine kinase [Effusibacillus lacus]|uniref:histidine kinase n=2 Tax=Effusibacillus lacus TaxID=1348429 RepID=A0A292YT67_9BACL|nr:HAMP domain-containing sensor histidine kinase [Effusibacillus lacus]GAX91624.1 two-component sensor histidine kinase [Effusibacillus lacus]